MTDKEDLKNLTILGNRQTKPVRKLETFPNHHHKRNYVVTLSCDNFTCLCPITGQPDYASIRIEYIPDMKVVESKSLKLYFWSYRDEGIFHEHLANMILDDLVKALSPRWCRVIADFEKRGGIAISVDAEYPNGGDTGT